MKPKTKGLSAWLITWEWCGEHAAVREKVAEILDPRLSSDRVRETVELLYHRTATLSEKAAWRLLRAKQQYPAEFMRLEGVPWKGEIRCGHNPWLLARIVDGLQIETDAEGVERAIWKDRHDAKVVRETIAGFKNERKLLPQGCP